MRTTAEIAAIKKQLSERLPQLTSKKISEARDQYYDYAAGAHIRGDAATHSEYSQYVKLCREELDRRAWQRQASQAQAPATDRQVAYLITLLHARRSEGRGDGFASLKGLYTSAGEVDRAAVTNLTMETASALIDSLKSNY